jgi:predicted site-specific integrase-resolvase
MVDLLEELFTVSETARHLRVSVSSLNKWRGEGGGPRYVLIGRRIRYRPSDIAAYVREQTRTSTSAPARRYAPLLGLEPVTPARTEKD